MGIKVSIVADEAYGWKIINSSSASNDIRRVVEARKAFLVVSVVNAPDGPTFFFQRSLVLLQFYSQLVRLDKSS